MKGENNHVDITKKSEVTCVEWFHGYGGNALGLKRAIPGLRSVAVCERDAFVVANMVSKMEKGLLDAVPIWTDVTDFPTEPFGRGFLDLFVASYPCQGFSHAGKRLGKDDPRHLWPYCRKFIRTVRPGWVWLENVEGHVSLGLSTVLADLEEDGYTAAWGIFSASEVGAPHQRKRVFILAYDKEQGLEGHRGGSAELQRAAPIGTEVLNRASMSGGAESGELALGHSIGRSHGEPEIQSAEAGVHALGNAATSGGEDVAHVVNKGLQGHAGDVHRTGREPGGPDRPVAESSLLGEQVNTGWGLDNSLLGGCERGEQMGAGGEAVDMAGESSAGVWPSRPGERQYAWEPPRVADDTSRRGPKSRGSDDGKNPGHGDEPMLTDKARGEGNIQAQPSLGGNADGSAAGLDFTGRTGLSDTELAEIREWMVKGTNRTDELRMCGNGVVPATAERAFRVLYRELIENRK